MIKKILYSIVITILLFFITGLFLPREVHVERSLEINRPPATVFTVLNGYQAFLSWSPWLDRDPDAEYRLSGPDFGVGARLDWKGDPRRVGSGWQEILESEPFSMLRMRLVFDQQGRAESYFRIRERDGGAIVTWSFDTDVTEYQGWFNGFLARYFGLFFDRWIGSDYEAGLARLKDLVESMPAADFSDLEVEVVEAQALDLLYVRIDGASTAPDSAAELASAYREITAIMAQYDVERSAQPMAITRVRGGMGPELWAAIPVLPETVVPSGRVRLGRSPAGRAARAVHRGPYEHMDVTYDKLLAWMTAHGLVQGAVSWEHYVSDPRETAAEARVTHLFILVGDSD